MAVRLNPELREELFRQVQAEFNEQQKTWGEWKETGVSKTFSVHLDYMSGEYWLVNVYFSGERYAIPESCVDNGEWKNLDIPIEAKAQFAIYLRQKGQTTPTPKQVEQRRHIPEVIERTGDKWYSWGLLRLKTVNGRWVAQAAVQLQDNANVEQHSTMVGYGATKLEALQDLQEQMYETRALIEDAIVNVQARTIEEEKLQGQE